MSQIRPLISTPAIAEHLATQRCSVQWRGFFQALSSEFSEALAPQDLRALMFRVGVRFAADHPLAQCTTLNEMQSGMTAIWRSIDWGWVDLEQDATQLTIRHTLSPMTAAFGHEHVDWSCGFLEGVYQSWFQQAGAGQLKVSQAESADAWGCVVLHLAR